MTDAALVNILYAGDQLLVHAAGGLLVQALVRHNVVEQLAILTILHDEEKLTFSFNDFKQLDYVRVTNLLQNLYLAANPLDVLLVFDARLLQYLDGHLLVRKRVHGELDLAESALSERFTEDVVAEACALRVRILLLLIVLLIPPLVAFALLATVVIRGLIIGILSLLLSTL